MKLALDQIARRVGNARLDFLSFYAPTWAEPANLERMRAEIEHAWPAAPSPVAPEPRQTGHLRAVPDRSARPPRAILPHAA